MGNSQSLLCAHRTIPACRPECALQERETMVMTFVIGGAMKSHDRELPEGQQPAISPGGATAGRGNYGTRLLKTR